MLWLFYQHLRPKKRLSILCGWNANKGTFPWNCSGCESGPVLRELLKHLQWADLESCLEISWKQFRVLVQKQFRESAIELSRLLDQTFGKELRVEQDRKKGCFLKEGAEVLPLFLQQGQRCSFCQGYWINACFFAYGKWKWCRSVMSDSLRPHGW